ncbi:MAG TPA: TetR/AcrR family transcriptional regulator [Solirubrobacteraceae bacterium]|jgi:AcrR family transcriptional regulator
MPTTRATSEPPQTGRGRRGQRVSGDEREAAILATAERLLEEARPLADISVDDLARGAGISRPTFYFYFPSKDAVFLTLVDRLVQQAAVGQGDLRERLAEDPAKRWREALTVFYETFGAHRAVVIAGAQARTSNPEARALWSEVMEGWVADATLAIEAERERGAAPAGIPARELAIALVSMNERVLYATFADDAPAIDGERVVEVLLDVWLSAVYGRGEIPN